VKGLLDEQLSPQIAALLRQDGLDVDAVADRPGLAGRSDTFIFEVACSEARAVIANNIKDFRPIAAKWLAEGHAHAGLILLPSARTRTRHANAMLARRIAALLRENPEGLASSERWIGPLTKG
jgi:predicted nuclease of predicted toxin-antitoxin system